MKLVTVHRQLNDKFSQKEIDALKDYGVDEKSEFVRKGSIGDIAFVDGEKATIDIVTTAAADRDREVVIPKGVDLTHYLKNSVVLPGHDYSGLPIGEAEWIKLNEKVNEIWAKTRYAYTTDLGKTYYDYQYGTDGTDGFQLANSIGFVPVEFHDKGTQEFAKTVAQMKNDKIWVAEMDDVDRIYTKVILLEYSKVAVPSNPEALTVAVSKQICANGDCSITKYESEEFERIPGDGATKTMSSTGHASVDDIKYAINQAMHDVAIDGYWDIADIYPVKYPNGIVVIGMYIENIDTNRAVYKWTEWDYVYDHENRFAELAKARNVEEAWIPSKSAIMTNSYKKYMEGKDEETQSDETLLKVTSNEEYEQIGKSMVTKHLESMKRFMEDRVAKGLSLEECRAEVGDMLRYQASKYVKEWTEQINYDTVTNKVVTAITQEAANVKQTELDKVELRKGKVLYQDK